MREIQNQYHGKKIISRYDDQTPENSVHVLYEIQGSGRETWAKSIKSGNQVSIAKILNMPCWNEIGQFPSLADAIHAARNPAEPVQKDEVSDGV